MPVAKLLFVNIDIQFHDPALQPYLNILYRLVVNARLHFLLSDVWVFGNLP